MERREFIKKSCGICVLGMANLMIPGLMKSVQAGTQRRYQAVMNAQQELMVPIDQLTGTDSLIISCHDLDAEVAVTSPAAGTYLALYLQCTHLENPLNITGNGYQCTVHGSQYAPDGRVLKGPAEDPLQKCPTRVDAASNTMFISMAGVLADSNSF